MGRIPRIKNLIYSELLMGQYYKPISLTAREYMYSHDYDNGSKLMEHSWFGNNFVTTVENLLVPGGNWYKHRIVWAGDYMDNEIFLTKEQLKAWKTFKKEGGAPNLYDFCYAGNESGSKYPEDLVAYMFVLVKPSKTVLNHRKYKYLCSHDNMEYVRLDKLPITDIHEFENKKGKKIKFIYRVHPLPLLTCSGNGRGGGDYWDKYPGSDYVGGWAGHVISLEDRPPEDFEEFMPGFRGN